jgi:hypothetical protein
VEPVSEWKQLAYKKNLDFVDKEPRKQENINGMPQHKHNKYLQ